MAFLPSFPDVHLGFGTLSVLASELLKREIDRPLVITDHGLVAHGVCQKLLDTLPAGMAAAVFEAIETGHRSSFATWQKSPSLRSRDREPSRVTVAARP